MTLLRNMKIGTLKLVTIIVDEKRAKRFYDRIMSDKRPRVTIKQLVELRDSKAFRDMKITSYGHNFNYRGFRFIDAVIDGKVVGVIIGK